MPIDREVLEAVREMDEHELRRLFILARARLEERGVTFPSTPDIKLRSQMIRCGKDSCRTCPHGPYWYAYWWEEGKRRSRYVGKLDDIPEKAAAPGSAGASTDDAGRRPSSAERVLRSVVDSASTQ